jgi:hypothetical protein
VAKAWLFRPFLQEKVTMTDDFISSFRSERDFDDEPEGDLPDWIEETEPEGADIFDEEDEFDQLRVKSARTGSTYDEMDLADEGRSEGLSLSHLTPPQRVILAVLLLLDVVVIVVGVLLIYRII